MKYKKINVKQPDEWLKVLFKAATLRDLELIEHVSKMTILNFLQRRD